MDNASRDNREYVRRSLRSRITVVRQGTRQHVGTLVDVSTTGIGVTGYLPFEPGVPYSLALLHLEDYQNTDRLARFEAECVWSREISTAHFVGGFRLLELSEQAQLLLDSL